MPFFQNMPRMGPDYRAAWDKSMMDMVQGYNPLLQDWDADRVLQGMDRAGYHVTWDRKTDTMQFRNKAGLPMSLDEFRTELGKRAKRTKAISPIQPDPKNPGQTRAHPGYDNYTRFRQGGYEPRDPRVWQAAREDIGQEILKGKKRLRPPGMVDAMVAEETQWAQVYGKPDPKTPEFIKKQVQANLDQQPTPVEPVAAPAETPLARAQSANRGQSAKGLVERAVKGAPDDVVPAGRTPLQLTPGQPLTGPSSPMQSQLQRTFQMGAPQGAYTIPSTLSPAGQAGMDLRMAGTQPMQWSAPGNPANLGATGELGMVLRGSPQTPVFPQTAPQAGPRPLLSAADVTGASGGMPTAAQRASARARNPLVALQRGGVSPAAEAGAAIRATGPHPPVRTGSLSPAGQAGLDLRMARGPGLTPNPLAVKPSMLGRLKGIGGGLLRSGAEGALIDYMVGHSVTGGWTEGEIRRRQALAEQSAEIQRDLAPPEVKSPPITEQQVAEYRMMMNPPGPAPQTPITPGPGVLNSTGNMIHTGLQGALAANQWQQQPVGPGPAVANAMQSGVQNATGGALSAMMAASETPAPTPPTQGDAGSRGFMDRINQAVASEQEAMATQQQRDAAIQRKFMEIDQRPSGMASLTPWQRIGYSMAKGMGWDRGNNYLPALQGMQQQQAQVEKLSFLMGQNSDAMPGMGVGLKANAKGDGYTLSMKSPTGEGAGTGRMGGLLGLRTGTELMGRPPDDLTMDAKGNPTGKWNVPKSFGEMIVSNLPQGEKDKATESVNRAGQKLNETFSSVTGLGSLRDPNAGSGDFAKDFLKQAQEYALSPDPEKKQIGSTMLQQYAQMEQQMTPAKPPAMSIADATEFTVVGSEQQPTFIYRDSRTGQTRQLTFSTTSVDDFRASLESMAPEDRAMAQSMLQIGGVASTEDDQINKLLEMFRGKKFGEWEPLGDKNVFGLPLKPNIHAPEAGTTGTVDDWSMQ